MNSSPNSTVTRHWTSVGRWTILGTLICIAVSILFNRIVFDDLGGDAVGRAVMSATVLPLLLGTPLFLFLSMRVRGLALSNMRLRVVARTDSLTACLNRGAFAGRVEDWLHRAPQNATGALLMIDADNFKAINDLFGHQMGDEALTIIARSIRAILRPGDVAGRMGGEEFAVFLPNVSEMEAQMVAERIRRAVYLAMFVPDGQRRHLSVSIGGAVFERTTTFSTLFRIADQRLYGAKNAGRNAIAVAQVDDHPDIRLKLSA